MDAYTIEIVDDVSYPPLRTAVITGPGIRFSCSSTVGPVLVQHLNTAYAAGRESVIGTCPTRLGEALAAAERRVERDALDRLIDDIESAPRNPEPVVYIGNHENLMPVDEKLKPGSALGGDVA